MLKKRTISKLIALLIVAIIFGITSNTVNSFSKSEISVENKISSSELEKIIEEEMREIEEEPEPKAKLIVYDGLTKEELINKLNRVLHSKLSGTGESFVNYSLELGVDPYLAVAIVLQETGCYWNCSAMVRDCNNIGGMKGYGDYSCWGGSYAGFNSLDTGISRYMNNLKNTYVSRGMTTAEEMNRVYAEDPNWSSRVNNYISIIRNS